jgi:hypothetical protein
MIADYYRPTKISELKSNVGKVAILGKVIESSSDNFVVDDDSGKVEIASDKQVANEKIVRVFCSVAEGKLKADVVQELAGIDMDLFNKMQELYEKVGL